MKKVAILQSNYIPWKGYFDIINSVDLFIIYDEVQYTKNDWRNRNVLKTPQGLVWLTIPVIKNQLSQKISETQVANMYWTSKHWKTIKNYYSKAKYFKEYAPLFEDLYSSITTSSLSEINLLFIQTINKILNINTEIIDSESLDLQGDNNLRLIDAVKKVGGTHYLSGPSAKSYLNEELFLKEGIEVEWMDYSSYREYNQLFPPFVHAVSVLDLIFNEGENAKQFIVR
ncbi:MAG: WbqC family protein [Chitinophagales bacterium]|nr:WbqC family protein [Chitinophagales bacterium]